MNLFIIGVCLICTTCFGQIESNYTPEQLTTIIQNVHRIAYDAADNPIPTPIPLPPLPIIVPSKISLIFAMGLPTTTPRHFAGALGIGYATSDTQEFFGTILFDQQPNTNLEQVNVLLGLTQSLGTTTIAGVKFKSWVSVAFGTALKNVSISTLKPPSLLTPEGIISSISTNPEFTSQYVFGFGYKPTWCNTCEYGPLGKYIQVTGESKQFEVGLYFQWCLK